ncbi:hypothetical protein QBC36DRAFT_176436 [Triangularia setosa]|uniref:Uncharacterized protein n=1 Tax=Triangularia setosa TaxID=2587417 RepID=A0AAN7AC09_9PEZI|nr:hypothetical protein QBC36DRAFT_176436 [Podospora setosa]
MKQLSIASWLLAGATLLYGGVDAAPGDPIHHLPPSVPRPGEKPGGIEYPLYRPVHSLHALNLTRVWHVHKCLQDWCDNRELIWELGGKIRCKSDHPEGENVMAWICNMGYYRKACSSAMLNEAAKQIIESTSDYMANSPSGHVYYSAERSHSFVFGWDTYCDGSPTCGGYRDPTIVCENQLNSYRDRPAPKAVQYESIVNGYGSVHHDGYQDEGEKRYEEGNVHEDDEEFSKYQHEEVIKSITIEQPPVKNKIWPLTQDGALNQRK